MRHIKKQKRKSLHTHLCLLSDCNALITSDKALWGPCSPMWRIKPFKNKKELISQKKVSEMKFNNCLVNWTLGQMNWNWELSSVPFKWLYISYFVMPLEIRFLKDFIWVVLMKLNHEMILPVIFLNFLQLKKDARISVHDPAILAQCSIQVIHPYFHFTITLDFWRTITTLQRQYSQPATIL